jgi:hypothetical protein
MCTRRTTSRCCPEFRTEFSWTPEEAERGKQWSAFAGELTTNLHEVIGHGSGQVDPKLQGNPHLALREHYSTIEEARADLVALFFLPDPKLVELGIIPEDHHDDIVRAEYEGYTRNVLVQLRRVRQGSQIEEDHMRNRQLIVRWVMAHTNAIEQRTRDGKTFFVMIDPRAFHEGAGRLLGEIQRIKGEGDYEAAGALVETYGVHFDPALRDEVVARVDRLGLPSYTGFVMPRLDARRNDAGEIVDVGHLLSTRSDDADAGVLGRHATFEDTVIRHGSIGHEGTKARNLNGLCLRLFVSSWLFGMAASPAHAQMPSATRLSILQAEDRRAPTANDVAILRAGARSGDPLTARMGLRALGRLERPSLIPDITPGLRHPAPEESRRGGNGHRSSRAGLEARAGQRRRRRLPRFDRHHARRADEGRRRRGCAGGDLRDARPPAVYERDAGRERRTRAARHGGANRVGDRSPRRRQGLRGAWCGCIARSGRRATKRITVLRRLAAPGQRGSGNGRAHPAAGVRVAGARRFAGCRSARGRVARS